MSLDFIASYFTWFLFVTVVRLAGYLPPVLAFRRDRELTPAASLLPDSFAMDCPVTTDGNYINSHVTGYPTDEDDGNQRVGGLASMPVTNGVRYHAQQNAMQDLQ